MKRYFSLVLALALGGCSMPAQRGGSQTSSALSSSGSGGSSEAMKSPTSTNDSSSSAAPTAAYQEYSPYRSLTGSVHGLFFYASWSPFAVRTDAALRALSEAGPFKYPVFSVDFDEYEAVKTEFDITREDTIILIDENGKKIRSIMHPSEDELKLLLR